jgi:hypothetical protein
VQRLLLVTRCCSSKGVSGLSSSHKGVVLQPLAVVLLLHLLRFVGGGGVHT